MKLRIVSSEEAGRIRYEHFVKNMHWFPENESGLELDETDSNATHILVEDDGEFMAHARFVNGTLDKVIIDTDRLLAMAYILYFIYIKNKIFKCKLNDDFGKLYDYLGCILEPIGEAVEIQGQLRTPYVCEKINMHVKRIKNYVEEFIKNGCSSIQSDAESS